MLPFFYIYISCWLHGIPENYYKIPEGIVIFPYTPYLCHQSSSTFKKKQVFPSSKVAVIPLHMLEYNILQCLIIHIILPSQAIFQRNQQFKIHCDGVRSGLQVGCSNNFVMAPPPLVYALVWHGTVMVEQQNSVVIPGNDIQKNNTCCILKDCRHFSTDGTHLKFIFLGEVVWHHSTIFHLDLGPKWWTQVSNNLQHKPAPPCPFMCMSAFVVHSKYR